MLIRSLALLLCATGALAWTIPASAQVISGDYYEDTGGMGTCAPNTTCTVYFHDFPASTAGKFIILSEVACDFSLFFAFPSSSPTALTKVVMQITDSGANPRRQHPLNASGKTGPHSFRETMNYKVAGGPPRRPSVILGANVVAGYGGSCTLVGRIVPN